MATDDGPIGRYGTIHYMKRSEDVPLVSYPVDDDTVTFGRSNDVVACQIRLYDLWASGRHCQLIFNDGKAFLRIYGQNGVTVDGAHYMPSKDELSPTTVPLTDGSEFLIYKRRFVFQYPPKEQRANLLATPRPKSRKSLRMSMVNSAQVWTPNPRAKPEENLEMLRSPVRALEDQPPITMLEGEPVYVQDDGEDLVVVEKIDTPEPSLPTHSTSPRKPQTPSLHRAVLQRNAQRSIQKLNEVEEREVEESVAQALNFDSRIDEEDEDDEEDEKEEPQEEQKRPSLPASPFSSSVFRKSLNALGSILPFGSGSPERSTSAADAERANSQDSDADSARDEISEINASMHSEEAIEEESEEEEEEEEEDVAPLSRPHQLTSFYTPQVSRTSALAFKSHLGMSVGGKLTGREDPSDLESARRHLEAIRKLPRPVLIHAPDDSDSDAPIASAAPVPITPRCAKPKPRLSSILKPLPELGSSPTRQTTFSYRFTDDEDDWDPSTPKAKDIEAFNTGARLQEVMRQVQDARRRESIREARRSFAPGELFGIGVVGTVSGEIKDEEIVGENETKDASTPKANLTSATHVPATPSYAGVPGLFKNPPPPPKTPSFQGVTHLFSNPAIPAATPAYEGVKNIFDSPPPPPPALETRDEAKDIEMADLQVEERVESKEIKTPVSKGRKVKKSTPAAVQTQQEEVEYPVPKSTKRGRKAATPTPAVEPEEIPEPTLAVSKRRTRSQSVEPTEEVIAVPVTATRSRRGRTPALEETEETVQATPVVNRVSKRGKKAAVVVEEPPLEVIDEDIQMDVEPAELAAGSSTKRTRNAKATVVEEETLTPTSGKRKTNARSAKVPTTTQEDTGADHIPEAEAETVDTPAPPKSRSHKMKASEDSITPSSRLPRTARTLRTPLMDSTTTKDEEQEVEADLVASTGKKTPAASRVKGVRSAGSSGARSKSSSAATSSSSARRAKAVDENTAPAVLEPATRVTRTRGRK